MSWTKAKPGDNPPQKKRIQQAKSIVEATPKPLQSARLAGSKNHFGSFQDSTAKMGTLFGVRGFAKHGKSDLAYSTLRFHDKYGDVDWFLRTRPLFYIDTHLGTKRVQWRYKDYVQKPCKPGDPDGYYFFMPFDKEKGKIPEPEEFIESVDQALNYAVLQAKEHGGGMIVIDSLTDYQKAMNLIVKKDLGLDPGDNIEPKRYQDRNRKLREMILRIKAFSNAILIADDVEIFDSASLKSTGVYKPDWYYKVSNWIDIEAQVIREGYERKIKIADSGLGMEEDKKLGYRKINKIIQGNSFEGLILEFKERFAATYNGFNGNQSKK